METTGHHIEDQTYQDDKDVLDQEENAVLGTRAETELSVSKALKYYRKAILWSVIISMATVMESYDLMLINSFYAYPQFQKKYGVQLPNGKYSLTAEWQVGLSLALTVGMMPGVFVNGYLVDKYGFRRVMLVSHIFLIGAIFATVFAPNVQILLVGCILM